jgi:hypothetical protein
MALRARQKSKSAKEQKHKRAKAQKSKKKESQGRPIDQLINLEKLRNVYRQPRCRDSW